MTKVKAPFWTRAFGRIPTGIEERHLGLLGVVALALLFEEYDLGVLNLALSPIAADLGMEVEALPGYLKWIRLGALPAFLVVPLADRLGRRPVFVFSTAAMGVLTFLTAFTQTPLQFVICQACTRAFFLAGSAVAFVIITEEFPAQHRGWGMGILAALGAVGHGMAAAFYALAQDMPFGWRGLYAIGIVPFLMTPMFLARIPETDRFRHHTRTRSDGGGFGNPLAPLLGLAQQRPGRALGIAVSASFAAVAALPCFQFSGIFVQRFHGWSNAELSMMVLGAGGIGIIGNVVAGRLGDLFGRKRIGVVLMMGFPICVYGFYNGDGFVIPVSYACLVFCSMGGRLMLRALSTELFPTSQRGAASGLYAVLETLGAVAGLQILEVFELTDVSMMRSAVPLVACAIIIAALVLMLFPETRQKELEDIH